MTEHSMKVGTTFYEGKIWQCTECGQWMKCVEFGRHKEVEQPQRYCSNRNDLHTDREIENPYE